MTFLLRVVLIYAQTVYPDQTRATTQTEVKNCIVCILRYANPCGGAADASNRPLVAANVWK
jgi:hypothetical protein